MDDTPQLGLPDIEDEWQDVDFEQDDHYINGVERRKEAHGELHPALAASVRAAYPRSEWPEIANRNRSCGLVVRRVYNQGGQGQCAVSSSVQAWFIKAILQFGWESIPPDGLTSQLLYRELVSNPNQGIAIGEALNHFRNNGTIPLKTEANQAWMRDHDLDPSHCGPESQWSWRPPPGIESTREHFRPRAIGDCADIDDMVASSAQNDPIVYGRSGHAIVMIDFWAEIQRSRVVCWLDYLNSWGHWGSALGPAEAHKQYGRGRDSESAVADQIRNYGAYPIHAVYESHLFE